MAGLDSCVSRSKSWKQMMLDDVEDEWSRSFSSSVLQFQELSNCHECSWMQQFQFFNALAKVLWNRWSTLPVDDGSHKNQQEEWRISMKMMKKCEKVWRKLREFDEFSVRSEIVNCDYVNSVTIKHIYHFLIQLLIKISKIKWISEMKF